jgi:hypothetical protein
MLLALKYIYPLLFLKCISGVYNEEYNETMEENYGIYEFIGRVQNLTTVIRILDYELYTMIEVALLSKEGKSNLYY